METVNGIFYLTILFWVATAIIHIIFAFGIYIDSEKLFRDAQRETWLVPGAIWAFATLIGGVIIAGIYWLIHHSALNPAASNRLSFKPLD